MSVGRINWNLVCGRALLVYQMPKVGSQTIESTLQASSLPQRIYRFHYLSDASAAALRQSVRTGAARGTAKREVLEQLSLRARMSFSLRLRRRFCAYGFPLPPLLVITAVRDIITAALSSIFQNYSYFAASPELLTQEICRKTLVHPKTCQAIQDWFDLELRPHIGIDVFEQPFPTQARHAIYESRFARVLLYRFDLLPDIGPFLEVFVGQKIQELISRNLGAEKAYSSHYAQVRQQLWLSRAFVAEQLGSQLMRHFYSREEIEGLWLHWNARLSDPPRGRKNDLSGRTYSSSPSLAVSDAA